MDPPIPFTDRKGLEPIAFDSLLAARRSFLENAGFLQDRRNQGFMEKEDRRISSILWEISRIPN